MATTANTNSFNLSGFIAVDAQIREFTNSAVARFPLSISRKEENGETTTRKSALINCECWRKSISASTFSLLKKGKLVQLGGYIRPDEWVGKDGTKHSNVVFVVTSVGEPKAKEAAPAEEKEAPKGKTSKKKEVA